MPQGGPKHFRSCHMKDYANVNGARRSWKYVFGDKTFGDNVEKREDVGQMVGISGNTNGVCAHSGVRIRGSAEDVSLVLHDQINQSFQQKNTLHFSKPPQTRQA